MPTHNMARFLPEAIESVCENTFSDLELLVVDDGSTDHTQSVIQEMQEDIALPIRYFQVPHRGKSAAVNAVLQNQPINGDYIAFMDADDTLPPHSLERRYDMIVATESDMVIGAFDLTNPAGDRLEKRSLQPGLSKSGLLRRCFYGHKSHFHLNASLVSKSLVKKTGLFDERLMRGQELEYAIRLLKHSASFNILPEVVYHYRKYQRPVRLRLKHRLETMRCRRLWLGKHLNGIDRLGAVAWQTLLDMMKLVYELFRNYGQGDGETHFLSD